MSFRQKLKKFALQQRLKKNSKLRFSDIRALSFDVPELITNEVATQNDYYYNAFHIKKFIGREDKKYIKAPIEHGLYYRYYHWDADVNSQFKAVITMGELRRKCLEKVCPQNKIITIGPYLNYVEGLLNEKQFKAEKKKLGRNLLVFPGHSTHHVGTNFDIEWLCGEINKLAKDFDSTTICLYWKDVLRGGVDIYKKFGFNCVCAGHLYDPYFLPRLKSIIELSDYTVSNEVGTHIGYSLFLNKPHYFIKGEKTLVAFGDFLKEYVDEFNVDERRLSEENLFAEAFSEYGTDITKEQYDFTNGYFGFDQIKTKDELKMIIEELDKLDNQKKEEKILETV